MERKRVDSLFKELVLVFGLVPCPSFMRDFFFLFSLILGSVSVALYDLYLSGAINLRLHVVLSATSLSLVLLQPILEELLFRGFIQGRLRECRIMARGLFGITPANLVASLLFVAAHLIYRPPQHAIMIFFPAVILGMLRDRHGCIYPSAIIHSYYNLLSLIFL
jgi:uncharacterized protein